MKSARLKIATRVKPTGSVNSRGSLTEHTDEVEQSVVTCDCRTRSTSDNYVFRIFVVSTSSPYALHTSVTLALDGE